MKPLLLLFWVSINVILRQREGVADEGDFRSVLVRCKDLDDIEAETDVGKIEQAEPGDRALGHTALLVIVDGVGRASALLAGAGFHFDEDESALRFVAADEVDFASPGRDEVAVEDPVAVAAEIFFGLALAPLTEDDVARRRLRTRTGSAPPVEKCGDGRGKGHGDGGLRGVRAHHNLCGGRSHTADAARPNRS